MNVWDWLAYFGIPTFLMTGMVSMIGIVLAKLKKYKKESEAIKSGLQALLRSNMISEYNKYIDKGYAPIYAKENFKNVYENYHSLGANGVMDEIKETFMKLPTKKEEED